MISGLVQCFQVEIENKYFCKGQKQASKCIKPCVCTCALCVRAVWCGVGCVCRGAGRERLRDYEAFILKIRLQYKNTDSV